MDTSDTRDSLNDTPTLPELSFDDLLDESPGRKDSASNNNTLDNEIFDDDDEAMNITAERKMHGDDTLNTPGPKKPVTKIITVSRNAVTKSSLVAARVSTNVTPSSSVVVTAKTGPPTSAGTVLLNTKNIVVTSAPLTVTKSSAPPVLLNSKNILPKMTTTLTSVTAKVTPKATVVGTGGGITPSKSSTPGGSPLASIVGTGKTALKTANGQIIYIQKATGAQGPTVKFATTVAAQKTTPTTTVSVSRDGSSGTKPLAIQLIRSGDAKALPVKPTAAITATTTAVTIAATTGGVTTATPTLNLTSSGGTKQTKAPTVMLSQSNAIQLAGKKLISTTGGQVVIKTIGQSTDSCTKTTTTTTPTTTSSVTTNLNALAAGNSNLIKNVKIQKISSSIATSVGTANTSKQVASTAAAVNVVSPSTPKIFVQSGTGKPIMVSNQSMFKLSHKTGTAPTVAVSGSSNAESPNAIQLIGKSGGVQVMRMMSGMKIASITGTTTSSAATATSATSAITTTIPASVATTKATTSGFKILNSTLGGIGVSGALPKKDGVNTSTSVVAKVVQKTIAVSKSLSNSTGSSSLNTTPTTTTVLTSDGAQLIRKHKIAEFNSKINRIVGKDVNDTSADEATTVGQPEVKKIAAGSSGSGGHTISISGGKRIVMMQVRNSTTTVGATSTAAGVTRQSMVQRFSVQRAELSKGSSNGGDSIVKKLVAICAPKISSLQDGGSSKMLKVGDGGTLQAPNSKTTVDSAETNLDKIAIQRAAQINEEKQQQHSKSLLLKRTYQQQLQLQQQQQASKLLKQNPSGSEDTSEPATKHSVVKLIDGSGSASMNKSAPQIKDEPVLMEEGGVVRRKHCNCSKSQCLKLYCDCFANGEFCQDCTCKDCFNNLHYEDERQQAIRVCLDRNPSAFKPKITTRDQGDMRLHNKGCNCKRSGCLKNYCECYEAKIPCSSNCKCVGCRNFDMDVFPMAMKGTNTMTSTMSAAVAGQKRSFDKISIKNDRIKDSTNNELINTASNASSGSGDSSASQTGLGTDKQQCNLITQEVIDATIQCMISQGDECEKNGLSPYQTEKMVIEECGRCLVEIIDFSIRNTQD